MKGTDTIRRFAFEYDKAGNRVSQLDVVDIAQPLTQRAVEWVYGYDWLDRLESVKKREATTVAGLGPAPLQLTSVYQYDAADNRTEFKVPNLQQPELTETFTYGYDDADNILSISKAVGTGSANQIESFLSDDDGNLKTRTSGGVTTEYHWNDFNRLAAISTSDNSKKQSHTFGVNGFRRKKKDKNDVETTEYAAGLATAVSKAQGGETITYLMGSGLMGLERWSDGEMFFFLTDALGSVRDIVSGTDGAVLQSYDYKENGEKTTGDLSGPQSQKTWIGGLSVNDDVGDSGLYLMGHRHYDPSLGRFLSQDPIGFAGGLNLYEYGRSSPTLFTDSAGLDPYGGEWNPNEYNPYEQSHILSQQQLQDAKARWDVTANVVTFAAGAAVPDPSDLILAGVFFGIAKGATVAGKYKKAGGHHVHAKAAFKGHPCYDPAEAFTVSQRAISYKGWNHQAMTNMQRDLFKQIAEGNLPNTLTTHTAISVEALVAGGATRAEARSLVAQSLRNLRDQGVYFPTDIPWYGKSIGTYK